jgi:hypothetical protein
MKSKPISRNLIRKYFGKRAKIIGFGGYYRVTTPTGGEVVISPREIKLIFGGDDVYRAVTLLAGERWGRAKARGSREFMLGAVAHGEASGVNIQADHSDRLAPFVRGLVFVCIVVAGLAMGSAQNGSGVAITLCVAVGIWWAMKRSARREEQRKAEQLGFHYPRVQGTAGAASDDELERKGWK